MSKISSHHHLGLLGLCLMCLLWQSGCATSTVDAKPWPGGAKAQRAWITRAASSGPVSLTRVVAANWMVERAGLINLEHPHASGLKDADAPVQIVFFVLDHPVYGRYLIDSGVARAFCDRDEVPLSWLVSQALNLEQLKVEVDLKTWLKQSGVVRGVFLTHLHLDHIMGLPDLPLRTPVYIGPGEASAKRWSNMATQASTDKLIGPRASLRELRFRPDPEGLFKGVLDIFGDGSVYALHVPGHTPGSVAFLVRTTDGPALILADASHTAWGWTHDVEPGTFNDDQEGSRDSFDRLKRLASMLPGVALYFGHTEHISASR